MAIVPSSAPTPVRLAIACVLVGTAISSTLHAAAQKPAERKPAATNAAIAAPAVPTPPDYLIGPDDVLSVIVWREKDLSQDVTVRPDGKISLPLLNDIAAAGLTPEELRARITEAAKRLMEDPTVTVVVRTINSRKVFVTGQVAKPGPYPLLSATTVLQLLATAGGVAEYADSKNIRIMRTESGKPVSYKFNYKDVIQGKNLNQNIVLKPGDTIIVP